jgi:hypothetical protein
VSPIIDEMASEPFGFVICVEPIVNRDRVEAGPNLCRTIFDVMTEFEAAIKLVLIEDGTVIGS